MKHIVGLREIADQFDLFLVDQYGVLHDGVAAYPGAVDGLDDDCASQARRSRQALRFDNTVLHRAGRANEVHVKDGA